MLPRSRRTGLPVRPAATSLPLLVCATALVPLAPAALRAQRPTAPDSTAPRAAQAGTGAAGAGAGADSARATIPACLPSDTGAVPPTSSPTPPPPPVARARAPLPDSACAGLKGPGAMVCLARAVMADSTPMRALAVLAATRALQHAAREGGPGRYASSWSEYGRAAFGPGVLLRTAALAGWEQLLGRPRGWRRDRWGYAERFGARLGSQAAAGAVRFQVASLLQSRPAPFTPCACQGTWPRLAHALAAPFQARRSGGGGDDRGAGFSPLTPLTELGGGMLTAGIGAGAWRPRQGMEAGLTGLLSLSLVATLREFRPWERWR